MGKGNHVDMEYAVVAQDLTSAPTRLHVNSGAVNAIGTALTYGRYRIVSNVDLYILQGNSAIEVGSANGHYLPKKVIDYISVSGTQDTNISAISDSEAGMLYISKQ